MNIMPIDTIRVRFRDVGPVALRVAEWRHDVKTQGKQEHVIKDEWHRDIWLENHAHLRFLYRAVDQYDPDILNCLYIEFSVPTVLYGCNHQMIDDWDTALEVVDEILVSQFGTGTLPNIRTSEMFRLDIAANLQVGGDVEDYLVGVSKATYPRRLVLPYVNEHGHRTGAVIKPRKKPDSLSIYSKFWECTHEEADGILRFERSMRRPSIISDKLGMKHCQLGDLTAEVLWGLLEANIRTLGLDRPIVSDRLEVESRLSQIYSRAVVRNLLGYLIQRQTRGMEQMIRGGMSRQSISRFERMLKDAGITSYSLDGRNTLPPLLPLIRALRNCDKLFDGLHTLKDNDPEALAKAGRLNAEG